MRFDEGARREYLVAFGFGSSSRVSATPIANLRARENTRKQIAALVGLAPLNRNSGQTRGHLTIREPANQTGETEVADRIFVCVLCVSFNARI